MTLWGKSRSPTRRNTPVITRFTAYVIVPAIMVGTQSNHAHLTSVCRSHASSPNREHRALGRLKLAQRQPASHVTRTILSRLKGFPTARWRSLFLHTIQKNFRTPFVLYWVTNSCKQDDLVGKMSFHHKEQHICDTCHNSFYCIRYCARH